MLELQTELVAIAQYEEAENILHSERTNLFKINDIAATDALIVKKSIANEYLEAAARIVEESHGVPKDVPLFGALAVKLGFVTPKVNEALL